MKRCYLPVLVAVFFAVALSSCKKEKEGEEDNENELITTVKLSFTYGGEAVKQVFTWRDLDGEGGNAPVIEDIVLERGKTYFVTLDLLDETKTPADDITAEVREEADAHRVYYTVSGSAGLLIDNLDKDDEGISLGTIAQWTATQSGTGSVRIVLRHYPSGGKEESDPMTSSKSSTDVDVSFNLVINEP